jgi:hypothetical protein
MSRTVLVLWVAAIGAVAAAILVLDDLETGSSDAGAPAPAPAPGTRPEAVMARDFADSIGLNVHLTYTGTPYSDFDRVLASLRELGVRHVRDGLVPRRPDQYERLRRLAGAGIHSTLIMGAPNATRVSDQVSTLKSRVPRGVEAVEGPNEYDVSGEPDWADALRRYQRQLYTSVKNDADLRHLDVFGPTVVSHGNLDVIGDVRGALDTANIHPYPGSGPPEPALDRGADAAARSTGKRGLVATETGYHNAQGNHHDHPGVSEAIAADYLPRLFLSAYADGIRRTYWYELVDVSDDPRKPESNFGLLRHDFTPKPAFTALRNLMRLVEVDDGRSAPAQPLDLSISEPPRRVRRLLLRRGDGVVLLALWREDRLSGGARRALDDRPMTVRVRLPRRAAEAAVYRPSRSSRPERRLRDVAEVDVPVAGDAVIVELRLLAA